MTDTIRTRSELVALLPDNVSGEISPQDLRDILISTQLRNSNLSVDVGDGSVRMNAADGVLALASTKPGGQNEGITVDFETANSIVLASTTGVTTLRLTNIGLHANTLAVKTTAPTYSAEFAGTATTDAIRSHIGLDLYPVPCPSSAPTLTNLGAGNVDAGEHFYTITFKTAIGETDRGPLQSITLASNSQVRVTLPISTDPRVTARRIYRTKANRPNFEDFFLAEVANNTATFYDDNIPDSSLTIGPAAAFFRGNTTCRYITKAGAVVASLDEHRVFLGPEAGANATTGGRNVFIGFRAGAPITTGSSNVFVGYQAGDTVGGSLATTVAVGTYAGRFLNGTSANQNVAIGYYALGRAMNVTSTTAVGYLAGFGSTSGISYCTFIGSWAGCNTTGTENVCLGMESGHSLISGQQNTLLGNGTGRGLGGGSSNVFIGYQAGRNQAGTSNTLIIDNQIRLNAAEELIRALVVGTFNADPVNQTIQFNAGKVTFTPAASVTPTNNGHLVIEATSNTQLTFKYRGSDGVVRSASLTLS